MKIIRKRILLGLFMIFVLSEFSNAEWKGPTEIISGTWGSGKDQFGITYQDTTDFIPILNVTSDQKIVLRDGPNRRVKVYSSSGDLEAIIPYRRGRHYTELTLADSYGFSGFFAGYGKEGINYYRRSDQKLYVHFSSTGEVIRTTTEAPLELGKVVIKSLGNKQYKVKVTYPDKTINLITKSPYGLYVRDDSGHLNIISTMTVRKYDRCGQEIGALHIPKPKYIIISPGGRGFEEESELSEGYGEPVIALNGDVYTWKRIPGTYSIVKWTWQDDPKSKNDNCKE